MAEYKNLDSLGGSSAGVASQSAALALASRLELLSVAGLAWQLAGRLEALWAPLLPLVFRSAAVAPIQR